MDALGHEDSYKKGMLFHLAPGGHDDPEGFGVTGSKCMGDYTISLQLILDTSQWAWLFKFFISKTRDQERGFAPRLKVNQQGAVFPQRENPDVSREPRQTKGACAVCADELVTERV